MAGSSDRQQLDGQEQSSEYKMVVLRADDLQEVRSVQLSVSNIYVLISIVLLTLSVAIFSLLAFTPLKNLIPGYGRIEANEEFIRLVEGVDDINERIEAQDLYMAALRNLIVPSEDSTAKALDLPPLATITTDDLVSSGPVLSTTGAYSSVKPPIKQAISADVSSDLWSILERNPPQRPVEGIINSDFDPSIKHFGVDVLAPAKTPIRAIMDGYVITSGWDLETGYTVGVQHEGQILSFYKHNSHLLKEKGTFVKAGEAVAIIGNTGTLSNGPHLHFEFWHNGKPINPKDIINFN